MRYIPVLVLSVLCMIPLCPAEDENNLGSENARINYSVGYQIGGDFKRQGVQINPGMLVKGIQDVLEGNATLMTGGEMDRTLVNLRNQIGAGMREEQLKGAERNLAVGRVFLEENKDREGVHTLSSGLQYKVIREGTGTMPSATDTVTVHYRGTFVDGTEFDSSYSRGKPVSFKANRVISGWNEALLMMREGSRWQLFIPPDLAYGERGAGSRIAPNSTLIFEVELISIEKGNNVKGN